MNAASAATKAQTDAARAFHGKTIELAIGFGPGGGYDVYARLIANYLAKYIPGNPTVVPQNMPGAGSRIAANWIANAAPRDGTALAMIDQSSPLDQAMGEPGIKFDTPRLAWIGNPIMDNLVTIVTAKSGVKRISDLRSEAPLFCGDVGAGPTNTFPQVINRLLGLRNKIVSGYTGVNAIYLAMDRGEVNCIGGTTWSSMKATRGQQLRDRKFNLLLQWGAQPDPDISAYSGADVPLSLELAKTPLDRQAVAFINSSAAIGRPIVAPPDLSPGIASTLRRAFKEVMADPDFLRDAAKSHMAIKPMDGDSLQTLVTRVARTPQTVVKRAEELTGLPAQH